MNQDGQSLLLVHVFANTRAQMIATKTRVLTTPYCVRMSAALYITPE